MAITLRTLIICTVASLLLSVSCGQNCKNYQFSTETVYKSCTDLPTLGAHLYWNHDPSANTLQIAYRADQMSKGWIAWGINPNGSGMVGTQAFVAFHDAKGAMKVYTTKVDSYSPAMKPESLSFPVSKLSAEYLNNEMIIFAVLGPLNNGTNLNIVWQAGNSVQNDIPQMHPLGGQNIKSYTALDFRST